MTTARRTGQALVAPRAAGTSNRARLVQALSDMGPLSRAELARLLGITRATVGALVQTMLDEGVLAEQESRPSSAAGGKPARPLWFAPEGQPFAAAHLLPGSVDTALISAGGTVLATARRTFPVDAEATLVTEELLGALKGLLPRGPRPPIGVGIAVGGMVDTDSGTIVNIALAPKLNGLPIGPLVSEALGLPVWIDLHPRVQALGDRWFGQGRGRDSFASLYISEAIGVGLISGGMVHRGAAGSGGEIGHTTVDINGKRCHCGRTGCWETIANHGWLREQALERGLPGAGTMTAGPLSRLAASGNHAAGELLDRYAANLAVGMANLHQTFAPGLFILHGDVVAGGEALRERIQQRLRSAVPTHPVGPPQVAFTTLDDQATLLGAVGLVLSYSLHSSA